MQLASGKDPILPWIAYEYRQLRYKPTVLATIAGCLGRDLAFVDGYYSKAFDCRAVGLWKSLATSQWTAVGVQKIR
jgi:hypothetical protein